MERIDAKTIKDLVSEIKFRAKLTQKQIAERIGVAPTYLSDVINGKVPYIDSVRAKLIEHFSDCFNHEEAHNIAIGSNNIQQSANGNNIKQQAGDKNVERFLNLLEKKDEQIDRLLTIIENCQKN